MAPTPARVERPPRASISPPPGGGAHVVDVDHTIARVPAHYPPPTPRLTSTETTWSVALPDGRVLAVGDGGVVIGRQPTPSDGSQAAAFADHSLSKSHVRLEVRNGAVFAIDQHSTNGTVIRLGTSSTVCEAGAATRVSVGAVVLAGEVELRIIGSAR